MRPPCQVPRQRAIKTNFFMFFNKNKSIKLQKNLEKFINFKIKLQNNLILFFWIINLIIYHFKNSIVINNKRIKFYFKIILISIINYNLEK